MPFTRRRFLISSSAACAVAALGPRLSWAQSGEAFTPIRGNVGIFTGRGGTIGWLVAKDGMVVVDSQFPESAQACIDGLRHRSERRIDALINTHHHGDHTSGNGVFRPLAEKIVAHANVPELQKNNARENRPEPTVADTTFKESWTLDLGSEKVTARHYRAAHTGGDCVVYFEKANVVHMGDMVFNRWHPFIDVKGGASVSGWAYALHEVVEQFPKDAVYIFGHGADVIGNHEHVTEQKNYLDAVMGAARKGVRGGKSLDEVKAQDSLPGFDEYAARGTRLTLAASLHAAYEEISTTEKGRR